MKRYRRKNKWKEKKERNMKDLDYIIENKDGTVRIDIAEFVNEVIQASQKLGTWIDKKNEICYLEPNFRRVRVKRWNMKGGNK